MLRRDREIVLDGTAVVVFSSAVSRSLRALSCVSLAFLSVEKASCSSAWYLVPSVMSWKKKKTLVGPKTHHPIYRLLGHVVVLDVGLEGLEQQLVDLVCEGFLPGNVTG